MISPSMLRSSSKSGQWIPWPPPTNSQLSLSCRVAWTSLGYQTSGTEMVRPSASSAVRVSSVTVTSCAFGTITSVVEVIIPSLQKRSGVLFHCTLNPTYLRPPQSTTHFQSHRFQPELCYLVVARDVYVFGLVTIARIEEETVGALSQNSRHSLVILAGSDGAQVLRASEWTGDSRSVPCLPQHDYSQDYGRIAVTSEV